MKITDLASVDPTIDLDMQVVLELPCPECKEKRKMKVGDWVCWGMCFSCYDEKMKDNDKNI